MTIVALVVVSNMANQVEYATLFTGLSDEDAGNVIAALQEQGVDVKAAPDGTLLVPADQVEELQYTLQTEGVIEGDSLDYSIYSDNATSFGSTDQDKAYYEQAQLQQNISSTINKMEKIKSSVVLLALAEESPYVLSAEEPQVSSASVMVTLKNSSEQLEQSDVNAIRAIVSNAVPSLSEENISIVDQNMHVYGTDETELVGTTQVDKQIALQQRAAAELEEQIVNLLSPIFGPENLSASVNIVLDFDRTTTNSLVLSPPTNDAENMGIITSMKITAERLLGEEEVPEGTVGLDPNGGSPTYQEIDEEAQDSVYYNAVTEVNAEVNELSQQIEEAQGDIIDLSATLIINGGSELNDILPEVRQQIVTAIGVTEDRVTVSAMPFEQNTLYAQALEEQAAQAEEAEQRERLNRLIILGIIVAVIVIIVVMILRARKKKKKMQQLEEQHQRELEEAEALAAQQGIDVVADEELDMEELMRDNNAEMLDSVREIVENSPESVAQLLRNWISDDL